jgi:hypothetical protein
MGWIPRERGAANNRSSQPHQLTWKTKEIKLIVLDTSGNSVHKSPCKCLFVVIDTRNWIVIKNTIAHQENC